VVKVGVYNNYGAMWTTNALLIVVGVGDATCFITLGATNVLPIVVWKQIFNRKRILFCLPCRIKTT
jgi:hypothetical protein